MYKQIGNKVAYYRKLRNLTQDELADRVNISVSSLSKLERGKYNNNIPLSMLIMIAEGLRIDVSMLVTFDEREKLLEFEALCQMLWSIPDRNIFCPVFHEQNPIESRCFRWFLRSGLFNKNIIRRLKFTKLLKL